jgi:hypothetical protein
MIDRIVAHIRSLPAVALCLLLGACRKGDPDRLAEGAPVRSADGRIEAKMVIELGTDAPASGGPHSLPSKSWSVPCARLEVRRAAQGDTARSDRLGCIVPPAPSKSRRELLALAERFASDSPMLWSGSSEVRLTLAVGVQDDWFWFRVYPRCARGFLVPVGRSPRVALERVPASSTPAGEAEIYRHGIWVDRGRVAGAFASHPAVERVEVTAIPEECGEGVRAVVVTRPGQAVTTTELRSWGVEKRLVDLEIPSSFEISASP